MKMRDVFELPVEPCESFDDFYVRGCKELSLIDSHAEAATHAINCHDGLVEVLQMALALIKANAIDNPECAFSHNLAMRACDELHRAKGE